MNEEISKEGEETRVEEKEVELSPVEQRALEMGWRPKEEWEGDEAEFISAETFVSRKPLFDRIEHQNKELKEVRKTLAALQEHHINVKKIAFQEAITTLKQEKREALVEGDADKIVELDDKIADLRSQEQEQKQQLRAPRQEVNPDFAVWVDKNSWYLDSSRAELRSYADKFGLKVAQANPQYTAVQILREVEKEVKNRFKEVFSNGRKDQPSTVEGSSTRSSQRTSKSSEESLTEDERRVMTRFIRAGVLTKEEYLRDLKAIKEEGN